MSEFAAISANDPWQVRVRKVLYQFRELLHRHPGLAPVVATGLVSSITVEAERMDQVVAALEDAGFEGLELVDAYNVVIAAMCGFATLELSSTPAEEARSWETSCRRQIDAIDRSRVPALGRHVESLRNNAFMLRWSSGTKKPLDSSFDTWVDVVIGGLEQKVRGATAPSTQQRVLAKTKLPSASRTEHTV